MANDLTIRFTIRTMVGFEPLCECYLENDPIMARSVFSQLEASDQVQEADILQADLVESRDALPIDVNIKHTTLP